MLRKPTKTIKPVKRKSKLPNPIKRKRKNPTKILINKFYRIMDNDKYYIILYHDIPIRKGRLPKSQYNIIKWNDEDQYEFHIENYMKLSNGELIKYDDIYEIIGPYNSKQDVKDYLM